MRKLDSPPSAILASAASSAAGSRPAGSHLLSKLDISELRRLGKTLLACKPAMRSIAERHPLSVKELSGLCGISETRLNRALSRMADAGIVRFEKVDGQRARRPILPFSTISFCFSIGEPTVFVYGSHGDADA